ncbi:ribosome hibernation factor-recruiting GTPase MRF [Parasphingorhabdus pacifica]
MEPEPPEREQATGERRTPLIVLAGIHEDHVTATAEATRAENPAGTALVHHDLREIHQGIVRRRLRHGDHDRTTVLELAHGCVSCTLRHDLLPLLRELAGATDVERIVVRLDPALEPEAICWALQHVLVDDRPVGPDLDLRAVVTAVDVPSWLTDVSGDEPLTERGLGGSAEDERTLAQVAVGQVEFADAVVLAAAETDQWQAARTETVISRLTPDAVRTSMSGLDMSELLAGVPESARRGEVDGPHGHLLRGHPDFRAELGVSLVLFEQRRPFHPQRLHDALDVLLEGVVRTRGRVWVASQPDTVLWLESAGGGLGVGHAGPWLAALPSSEWADIDPDRRLRASVNWADPYGDRMQELVVIAHEADPAEITGALEAALLTDEELAAGESAWAAYEDPFGEWHVDPCADAGDEVSDVASEQGRS